MKEVRIAYIGGGSKAWAQILMKDLLLQDHICGEVKLYDIDAEASRKNQLLLTMLTKHEKALSNWTVKVYNSLEEVLPDSDFVVLSILPGTFDDMMTDVHLPEKYAIWQSVGDTVGPGGYRRALRLFEAYVPIAEAIRDHAPKAWVINYTNPMTLSLKVLYGVFPGIKAIGCCHEVFGTQKLLAKAYAEANGICEPPDRHHIHVNVQGINHFTWIDQATYKGEDLIPYYDIYTKKYGESGSFSEGESVVDGEVDYFSSLDKVKMDLFKGYGVVAAAGDRHLAEFMSQDYLRSPTEAVDRWGFRLTPVRWRIENDRQLVRDREAALETKEIPELTPSDEEGANIMIALAGVRSFITNANYPNIGQAPDLPLGAVVETNIAFSGDMAKPLMAGPMKPALRDLVLPHVQCQEAFSKALFERNHEALYRAFSMEPTVARLEAADRRELFKTLFG